MLQRRPADVAGRGGGDAALTAPGEEFLRRTRIRTRILLFSVLWGLLLVAVAFLLTWRGREAQRELTAIVVRDLGATATLEQILASQASWQERWQTGRQTDDRIALARRYSSVRQLVEKLTTQQVDVGSLPQLVDRFDAAAVDAAARWPDAAADERALMSARLKRGSDAISGSAMDSLRRIRRDAAQRLQSVEQRADALMLTALGVTWMIAIVTIALARVAIVKIVRPIEQLSRTATRIASEEKADELVPIAGDREIALLAHDFNRMVSALAQRDARLEELSRTDGLTGLPNFRAFEEELEKEIRSAARREHPFGLLVFDIDHFKKYNDRFGHLAGNEALVAFASTIASNLRDVDFAARYGGEEFVALLREVDAEPLAVTAERVRRAVESLPPIDGRVTITCSIGGAVYPSDGEDAATLFAAADRRLYRAKEEGRNRVCAPESGPVSERRPA